MCLCSIYKQSQEFIKKLSRPTQRLRHAGSRQRRQTNRTQTLVSISTYEFILRLIIPVSLTIYTHTQTCGLISL